jgi:response regulator RpfG family c-di-GMP phosphodiesterase
VTIGRNILALHHRGRTLCHVMASLKTSGVNVLTARVHEQAEAMLDEHRVDLVVAGMESYQAEAVRRLRERSAALNAPMILLVPEGQRAPVGNYDAIIFEPIEPEHLREVARALLLGQEPPGRDRARSAVRERKAS